jgi:hypothetical protein
LHVYEIDVRQMKYAYCDIHVILLLTFVNWSVFFFLQIVKIYHMYLPSHRDNDFSKICQRDQKSVLKRSIKYISLLVFNCIFVY